MWVGEHVVALVLALAILTLFKRKATVNRSSRMRVVSISSMTSSGDRRLTEPLATTRILCSAITEFPASPVSLDKSLVLEGHTNILVGRIPFETRLQ